MERTFAHPQELLRWITQFVTPLDAIRGDLVASARNYSSASLISFVLHPLINIDGENIVCPLPSTLDNLFGAGFYFTLFDAYKSHGEEANAQRFAALYGRFFEDYVGVLLERLVDPVCATVSPEIRYPTPRGEARSSDFFILDEARRLVVVEAAKTRLNLRATLVMRDHESLRDDIRRIVVANARQISRTLTDLRKGRFPFSCPYADLSGIFALIVAGQRLPGLYGVNQVVENVLRSAGGLPECRGFHVIDVDELEILAAEHYHTLPLGEILEAKADHPDRFARACRLQSFINQYTDIRPASKRIVSSDFDAFVDDVMMPTFKAWGIRD